LPPSPVTTTTRLPRLTIALPCESSLATCCNKSAAAAERWGQDWWQEACPYVLALVATLGGGRVRLQEQMVDLSEEALLNYHQIVNKTFRSEEEGYEFYNSYTLDRGFTVRRCYVERDITTKEICVRKFVCGR